jgi:hypothetical protein
MIERKMHKKDVLTAALTELFIMGKQAYINNVSNVHVVKELLFGKKGIIVGHAVSTGLNFGSLKVILSASSASFLVTAPVHSRVLRTAGLDKYRRSSSIMPRFTIWSMTLPISTRMAA